MPQYSGTSDPERGRRCALMPWRCVQRSIDVSNPAMPSTWFTAPHVRACRQREKHAVRDALHPSTVVLQLLRLPTHMCLWHPNRGAGCMGPEDCFCFQTVIAGSCLCTPPPPCPTNALSNEHFPSDRNFWGPN